MFGTITFLYEPSTEGFDSEDPSDPRLSIQFSSEANLREMTQNFERFLRAIGYPLDYDEFLAVISCGDPQEQYKFHMQYPEIGTHRNADPSSSVASAIAKSSNNAIEAASISRGVS